MHPFLQLVLVEVSLFFNSSRCKIASAVKIETIQSSKKQRRPLPSLLYINLSSMHYTCGLKLFWIYCLIVFCFCCVHSRQIPVIIRVKLAKPIRIIRVKLAKPIRILSELHHFVRLKKMFELTLIRI